MDDHMKGQYHEHDPGPLEPEVLQDGKPVYKLDTTPPEALVIHCSDPRFQSAFRRFVTEELKLRNYAPLVVGGAIHPFGAEEFFPKNLKVLWGQIQFFLENMNIRRIIIINHEDCLWYQKMAGFYSKLKGPLKAKHDLGPTALRLMSEFTGVSVETYWAALHGDVVTFHAATPTAP